MWRTIAIAMAAAALCGCGSKSRVASGEDALARGDYKAAARDFKAATKDNPSSVALFYNLGTAQSRAGDRAGAISSFREVLRFAPGDLDASEALACELLKGGSADDLSEAHELLEFVARFRQGGTELARVLNSLALVEESLRRYDLAVARIIASLAADPAYAPAQYNLADLCARHLKRPDAALRALDAYLAAEPGDPERVAKAKAMKADIASALPAPYSHATTADANAIAKSGAEAYAKKDYQKAEALFAKAAEADPKSFEARFNRAHALMAANRLQEAASAFAEAAALDPSRFDATFWQARLAYAAGDYASSIERFTGAVIPSWPDEPQSYLFTSYAYAQQKRYYEAEKFGELYLVKAVAANPKADTSAFKSWLDQLPKTRFRP